MKKRLYPLTTLLFFCAITVSFVGIDGLLIESIDDNGQPSETEMPDDTEDDDSDADSEDLEQQSLQSTTDLSSYPPSFVPEVPTSPQAQAFSRLGSFDVNNSSGVPDISIPLFTIDFYGYIIPLTLRYEAQPLKPGYNYDVFGLGWGLSGNSCISRVINDRADEYGPNNNPFLLDTFYESNNSGKRFVNYCDRLDEMNFRYDSYNITLPSGRNIPFFMYSEQGSLQYKLLASDSNVKIVCNYSTSSLGSINSFIVTDEDGVQYTFNIADKASNTYSGLPNSERNVAWLLTSVRLPNIESTINYEYNELVNFSSFTVAEPVLRIDRVYCQQPGYSEQPYSFHIDMQDQCCMYKMRFLKKITYANTSVEFTYLSDKRHISNIKVKYNNNTVKNFVFTLSGSKLSTLKFYGSDTTNMLKYSFSYHSGSNLGSYIDYWGNLGTAATGQDIGNFNIFVDKNQASEDDIDYSLQAINNRVRKIARKPTDISVYHKLKLQSQQSGDSRKAATPEAHGVLKSITYPNGGRTEFLFENHRFLTATAEDGDFVFNRRQQRIMEGGGFRIKSIKNYNANNTLADRKEYRYGYTYAYIDQTGFPTPKPSTYTTNEHSGCGEAVVDPNLLTFLTYDHSSVEFPSGFLQMLLGIHVSGSRTFEGFGVGSGYDWWWEARFSALNFRRLLGGRRAVVYPEITVYDGNPDVQSECASKTVYSYDIYDYDMIPSRYYMSAFGQTSIPDTAYFEPVHYRNREIGPCLTCEDMPERRDRLSSICEYGKRSGNASSWSLFHKEEYTYQPERQQIMGWVYDSEVSRGHCGFHTIEYGENRNDLYIYLNEFYTTEYQVVGRSHLKSKTITDYHSISSEGISRTENFTYTLNGKLSSRIYSDEYDKCDSIIYVGNYNGTNSVLNTMKQRNILTPILRVNTDAGNHSLFVSGQKIDYGAYDNKVLPERIYDRTGNSYVESIHVLTYDDKGRPTETVNLKTGIHTAYSWDSDFNYLLIKAENATLQELNSAYSSSTTGNGILDNLPNAMVQIWHYRPHVGVTEHTDASGMTMQYEYDSLGRLIKVSRVASGSTDVLQEYTYTYPN